MQAQNISDIFAQIRKCAPRVHCLTSSVAQNFTANQLLAVGAIPSMSMEGDEMEAFIQRSDALLVNLGMLEKQREPVFERAIKMANDTGKPWVLDPVFVERSPKRTAYARKLLALAPTVMKANKGEMLALSGKNDESESPKAIANNLLSPMAQRYANIMAMTAAEDIISDGKQVYILGNGSPFMAQVTATGCGIGAIVAAGLAVNSDRLPTVAGILAGVALAGELAEKQAQGPGSFAALWFDALYRLGTTPALNQMTQILKIEKEKING